jgi:hypothetical protein
VDVCPIPSPNSCGPRENNLCINPAVAVDNRLFAKLTLWTTENPAQERPAVPGSVAPLVHMALATPPAVICLFHSFHRPYDDDETLKG